MAQQFDVMQSLFGFGPADVQRQIQGEQDQMAAALASRVPSELGAGAFQAFRAQERGRGTPLFSSQEDTRLTEARTMQEARQAAQPAFEQGGLVGYLNQYAIELEKRGLVDKAVQARSVAAQKEQEARKTDADVGLKTAQTLKALTPTPGKPLDQADQIRLAQLQQQFGDVEGANRFRAERDAAERSRAAAGAPGSGEVKVSDIKGAQDIVATYTKAPQDRLSTVRQIRVSLSETKQGTGSALPQLRRDLVKLVGDNQIGQGEVQQALGSIGIVGDAISGINQLFTGVPSTEKLKDVEKFITALENEHAKSYNRGRETANKVLSEAKLSPETVKTLIPPEYKTGREKKTSGFVEGKIYKDANGNRARYVKGEWVPVQ
jgi:hypothetical protein